MMRLSSPHVHTQFCDGRSTAEEMVLSALSHGFSSIGFSSHAKQHFDHAYAMDDIREADYIHEIQRLKTAYQYRIRIWLGTELDLFCYSEPSQYDYTIGSLHLLPAADDLLPVDGNKEKILELKDTVFHGDGLAMADEYFRLYGSYIYAQRPQIAGHVDLIRKNNSAGDLFDENDSHYRKSALQALEMVRRSGAILEVNTGAMARYGAVSPYPARFLLEAWRNMEGEVILSSDCHYAPDIMAGYGQAVQLLMETGFTSARILGTGDSLFDTTLLEKL